MWLSDPSIVLPDRVLERGSLRIEDGHIVEIIEGSAPRAELNARGLTAFPGIIDLHGDMLEREIAPRPNVRFPTDVAVLELDKRLVSNGVTTAYAAVGFYGSEIRKKIRSEDRAREIVAAVHALRHTLLVSLYIHARYEVTTPSIAPTLAELLSVGQVHLVSLMDHTPGQGQFRDMERYLQFIAEWRNVSREAVEAEFQERQERVQNVAETMWLAASDIASMAVERGVPLASHDDDTPAKVELVASLGVSISEFPVTLEAAQEARQRGMHVVMGAPNALRGASHSGNLSALEAIEAGVVDILAADYHPASLLYAVVALAEAGIVSLHESVKLISQNPAAAVGLHDRGSIEIGKSADIVLVEMAERPRVRGTLRRGMPVYWDTYMARLSLAEMLDLR
ncbi:MAG: alpha-D-ribose 1-methylphosphonate 5-triphosphate diphosphatase [Chloroflexota bacterium]|nr:alpha-D-ribose 1-methylphosphonate 5-triphosphate diphosphatase [Chloroflexota bacterium]